MLNASAAFSGPHHAEEGRAQPSGKFTTTELTAAIRDLRMVVNPDTRIQMLVQIVLHHGLDDPDVVALALAELEQTRCSGPVSRAARAQLQPKPTLWPGSSVQGKTGAEPGQNRGEDRPDADQSQTKIEVELRLDPELGRLAIGLHKAALLRLWVIGRHLSTKRHSGRGWLDLDDLWAALAPLGVSYTRRHFLRLVRAGEGVFWTRTYNRIYFTGVGRLAGWLTACAVREQPDLVATNRPGVRDVYLSPAGTLEQWEAMLYAAWCAHRENPTIARATLEALFNRSQDTLRRWEQTRLHGIVSIRANDVQCPHPLHEDDRYSAYIPDHSTSYVAQVKFQGQWEQVVRVRWRTSNTYQVSNIRQHPKRGQARKVRKAVNRTLEQPADEKRGGLQPLKQYFDNARHLKDYTTKHNVIGYLWRGEARWGRGVFEINNTGFWFTWPDERVAAQQERDFFMF